MRYRLHADLVSAIEEQDVPRALHLVREHNAPAAEAAATTTAMTVPAPAGGQSMSR